MKNVSWLASRRYSLLIDRRVAERVACSMVFGKQVFSRRRAVIWEMNWGLCVASQVAMIATDCFSWNIRCMVFF